MPADPLRRNTSRRTHPAKLFHLTNEETPLVGATAEAGEENIWLKVVCAPN